MGNHLEKRLKKLEQRKRAFESTKKLNKRGNMEYKMPGSMNLHKQLGGKVGR